MDPAILVAALIGAVGSVIASVVGARAARKARSTDHMLRNGISTALGEIKGQLQSHGEWLSRIENRLNGHIADADDRYVRRDDDRQDS